MELKEDWMSAIQTAITELLKAHPNNASMCIYKIIGKFYITVVKYRAELRREWNVEFKNQEWQVSKVNNKVGMQK